MDCLYITDLGRMPALVSAEWLQEAGRHCGTWMLFFARQICQANGEQDGLTAPPGTEDAMVPSPTYAHLVPGLI